MSTPSFTTFGTLLKYLRQRAGLTQRQLAIAVGYSEGQICRLEQNLRTPDAAAVQAMFLPELELAAEPALTAQLLRFARDAQAAVTATTATRNDAFRQVAHTGVQPGNLPAQLTPLVGREQAVETVGNVLTARSRLVTLTGTGGVGKTSLALAVAHSIAECGVPNIPHPAFRTPQFPDGIWLAELAALADPALVPQGVAKLFALPAQTAHSYTDALVAYLKTKRLLLILDNCEHLIAACASLVEQLLRASPGLTILATSREALNIAGEMEWRVPPLATPVLPIARKSSLKAGEIEEYAAVRLLVERARLVQPNFAIDDNNALPITQICEQLDGIPLALELAAARLKTLPVEQIAERLASTLGARFTLLTGGRRTAVPRHQTLRAALDWSYHLLASEEQSLLCRLSIFAGGFTLAAAEAITNTECGVQSAEYSEVSSGPRTLHSALDLLSHLIDKSLVVVDQSMHGVTRYRLLETIREYGLERLAEQEEMAIARQCHAEYYLHWAESAEWELSHGQQVHWLDRLEADHDNLRAALTWSCKQKQHELAFRLGAALGEFWWKRSYINEGRQWLKEILDFSEGLLGAILDLSENQPAPIVDLGKSGVQQSKIQNLKSKIGRVLWRAGLFAWFQGDMPQAIALCEEGLATCRAADDQQGIAAALRYLSYAHMDQGNASRARILREESLALCREIGDKEGMAWGLCSLGLLDKMQGDSQHAMMRFEESLVLFRQLGDREGISHLLMNLGVTAAETGDMPQAMRLLEESLTIFYALGHASGAALALRHLGATAGQQGNYAQGIDYLCESLALEHKLGNKQHLAECYQKLAVFASARGQIASAVRLSLEAEQLYKMTNTVSVMQDRREVERQLSALCIAMGNADFHTAQAAGAALSVEEALLYIMDTNDKRSTAVPPADRP